MSDELNLDASVETIAGDLGLSDTGGGGDGGQGEPPTAGGDDAGGASPAAPSAPAAASPTPTPTTTSLAAPRQWRKEAAGLWEQLPPLVREEVAKREEDMFRGIEAYKTDANLGKTFREVIQPFAQTMQQYGVQPERLVGNLLNAHYTLAMGKPEQKLELFKQLAADYGVDLAQASAMQGFVDSTVSNLQQEVRRLQSQLAGFSQAQTSAVREQANAQLNAFEAEKDSAGELLHPHFNEVAVEIATFLSSGVASSLEDAYNRAIWANPVTRVKVQERAEAVAADKARKEAEERAAKLAAAKAANVKSSAKASTAGSPLGSMDDTLNAVHAAIVGRG